MTFLYIQYRNECTNVSCTVNLDFIESRRVNGLIFCNEIRNSDVRKHRDSQFATLKWHSRLLFANYKTLNQT